MGMSAPGAELPMKTQPGKPRQGFARAICRAEISTNCSGRQREVTRATSVPRQESTLSMCPFERASIAAALAMSAHCTVNLRPG